MLGDYTNNKMAAPAPVQLQRPVTVSDLVCCIFVYESNLFILSTQGKTNNVKSKDILTLVVRLHILPAFGHTWTTIQKKEKL